MDKILIHCLATIYIASSVLIPLILPKLLSLHSLSIGRVKTFDVLTLTFLTSQYLSGNVSTTFPIGHEFLGAFESTTSCKSGKFSFNHLCLNKLARYCTFVSNTFFIIISFHKHLGVDMVYVLRVTNGLALKLLNWCTCLTAL